jgi:hypothetical protein
LGASIAVDYRDPERSRVETSVSARLGATELASVRVERAGRVSAVVPAGFPAGTFDLVVSDASGSHAMLANAYTSVEPGKVDGAACSTGTECSSGHCVENVCCDSACTDLLYRCTGGTCRSPGLIGHWKFDEENPSATAADSSGNELIGALRDFSDPIVEFLPGRLGNALAFDGSTAWVLIDHQPAMDVISADDALSISAWIYKTGDGPAAQIIVGQQRGSDFADHFSFFFQGDQYLQFGIESSYAGHWATPWPYDDQWVHVAATWSRAIAVLYVGGEEVRTTTGVSADLLAEPKPWTIGGAMNTPTTDANEFFPGRIDDLRIYSVALTPADVAILASP